jgi:hypothetical protein
VLETSDEQAKIRLAVINTTLHPSLRAVCDVYFDPKGFMLLQRIVPPYLRQSAVWAETDIVDIADPNSIDDILQAVVRFCLEYADAVRDGGC